MATRRTRTAGKVEIPNVDDHVSKLEHMGKETVKKLQDIKGAAIQAGVDINIPENCINKGTFSMTCAMFHILTRSYAYICCRRLNARQCKQVVLGLLFRTSMSQPFLRS